MKIICPTYWMFYAEIKKINIYWLDIPLESMESTNFEHLKYIEFVIYRSQND